METNAREQFKMAGNERQYVAIDLKSFYASVECVERGRDPLKTNLVVADASRTDKTICLAVSPALKSYGIPGRPRLFELLQKVREINKARLSKAPGGQFTGASDDADELAADPGLELEMIIAPPRMAHYIKSSTKIYGIYMKYVAPEDVHVYSIDEVFIDVTDYLAAAKMTAREFAMMLVREVVGVTGITATAGVGTNLYLCKIAMDIVAKKMPADENGVRIAELDEMSYRKLLWDHTPLTDFWRIGRGYAKRLASAGMFTMGDVARCSLADEDLLYKLFGINAELLIDHAWGYESCTMADIKSYRPESNSLSSGQVLTRPYAFDEARLVMREMADSLVLDMVDKGVTTDQIVLHVGYDMSNLKDEEALKRYKGEIAADYYGRLVPKSAHGSVNLGKSTSSTRLIMDAATKLFDEIMDRSLTVRRINISAMNLSFEGKAEEEPQYEQMSLFTDYEKEEEEKQKLEREKNRQKAVLEIQKRFGKNAILKGMNFLEGGTARERNKQIGGHKA